MSIANIRQSSLKFLGIEKILSPTKDILSVLQAGGIVMIIQILGLGITFLSQVFFARWMGAHEFGLYTYGLAWAVLFSVPAAAGLPLTTIRFVADGLAHSKWGAVRGVINWSLLTSMSVGLIIVMIAVGTIYVLNSIYGLAYPIQLGIAFVIVPLLALLRVQSGIFRGFGWPALAQLPDPLLRNFFLIGIFYLLWSRGFIVTAEWALLITVGVLVFLNGLQVTLYMRHVPTHISGAVPIYESSTWLKTSLPLLLVAGFQVIVERTDIIMLGLLQEAKDVSVYFACSRVAGLILIVLTALSALSASKIAKLFSLNKLNDLELFMKSIVQWIFWPSVALAGFLVIFGTHILSFFGDVYTSGYDILLILIACQLINAIVGPALLLLNMTGFEGQSAKVFGWSCLLNVALNAVLIPYFSIIGAAIATGVTIIFWNVWLVVIVKKQLGILCFPYNPFVNPFSKV